VTADISMWGSAVCGVREAYDPTMGSAETAGRARREVIRLAHRGLDLVTFLRLAGEQIRCVVEHEGAACFFTVDPSTLLLTGHVNEDLARDDERRRAVNFGVMTNEYREEDYNKFAALATGPHSVGILAEATGGQPERSPRYHTLVRPFGLEAELRAAFVADGSCWGGLAMFRGPDQPGFAEADGTFLAGLSRPMAEGIRTALVLQATGDVESPEAPGLVLLDEHDRVEALSPSVAYWLEQLIDPGQPGSDGLPGAIHAVIERTRLAAESGEEAGPVRARIPTRSGRWLTVHGTLLEGRRKGTAVIIEPARRPEIAPLLLKAYALSDREQDVALCVLQGLSTAEIAERLFISAHTVQDHLKAIFDKVGIRTRRQLVSTVFFDHYFPRLQEERPIQSTEWSAGLEPPSPGPPERVRSETPK